MSKLSEGKDCARAHYFYKTNVQLQVSYLMQQNSLKNTSFPAIAELSLGKTSPSRHNMRQIKDKSERIEYYYFIYHNVFYRA